MLSELRNLPAPAKLNLFLHVTGRRADGYHLLETVFQFIDLADSLDLRLRDDGVVQRIGPPDDIAPEHDLTLQAAAALKAATGCRSGADIELRKRIPIGAGLGGGSSDAATVLLGLNRLWGLGLGRRDLIELARPLGADVPVFVFGRNAYATGIGDRLQPIELPRRWFVLVTPPVSVATPGVFDAPELTRNSKPITMLGFSRHAQALAGRNDLQPVVVARQPAVKAALDALAVEVSAAGASDARVSNAGASDAGVSNAGTAGADPARAVSSGARMTGSGACVFAAMQSFERAQEVARRVLRHNVGKAQVVVGLARHPLGSRQVG
jgi:4-diphosphocytidyl-2-C-methyl-D-erythritol kinase